MTPPNLFLRLTDVRTARNHRRYTWPWRILFLLTALLHGLGALCKRHVFPHAVIAANVLNVDTDVAAPSPMSAEILIILTGATETV